MLVEYSAAAGAPDLLKDWLTFGAAALGAIAWPVATLALVVTFRSAVAKLIHAFTARISNLTHVELAGGIKGTFAERLAEVADGLGRAEASGELPEALAPTRNGRAPTRSVGGGTEHRSEGATLGPGAAADPRPITLEATEYIAAVSPSLAVVQAFLPVEAAAREVLEAYDAPSHGPTMSTFLRASFVPEPLRQAVRRLTELRNRAAHKPDSTLTASAAVDYARTAEDVVAQIRALLPNP